MRINWSEGGGFCDEDLGVTMEEVRAVKAVGKGAMGTVFLVKKDGCDKALALKAMSKSVMEKQTDGLKRARAEREILKSLRHPFLPSLVGHVETDKIVGWVMDYCPGGDLNALRRRQSEKCFSECIIRFYAAEIVLALEHLHSLGVVYRDLKPENVLLQADGHIMLTDFDLSTTLPPRPAPSSAAAEDSGPHPQRRRQPPRRSTALDLLTSCISPSQSARVSPVNKKAGSSCAPAPLSLAKTNSFVGTEEYVSPEMVKGDGHDFAVDWWAMGILLYEMLYGETPFKGANRKETFYRILVKQPQFLGPWTPLRDLIQRLLIKEPHNRLGFSQEVKAHIFFRGLDWESMESVSRAPFVPPPLSLDDLNCMQRIDVEEYFAKQTDIKDATNHSNGSLCAVETPDREETDAFNVF